MGDNIKICVMYIRCGKFCGLYWHKNGIQYRVVVNVRAAWKVRTVSFSTISVLHVLCDFTARLCKSEHYVKPALWKEGCSVLMLWAQLGHLVTMQGAAIEIHWEGGLVWISCTDCNNTTYCLLLSLTRTEQASAFHFLKYTAMGNILI
jgi:hypothetical protein